MGLELMQARIADFVRSVLNHSQTELYGGASPLGENRMWDVRF